MKMASQRFCLRWNNHQSNLLSVFDQLLHAETFTDVTLAVDGQYLKAHKMVLSACSPYFNTLFVNHPEKHPIVILKDVPYSDMKSLLDFMYRGEVSVDQERLTAFLRVAESLRIKGLTEVNDDKPSGTEPSPPPPQLQRIQPYLVQQQQMQQQRQKTQAGSSLLLNNNNNNVPQVAQQSLLSSALASMPKRKRGRPRKLSGSSNGTGDYDDYDREGMLNESDIGDGKMGDSYSGNDDGSDDNQRDSGNNDNDMNESRDSMSPLKKSKLKDFKPQQHNDDNSTSVQLIKTSPELSQRLFGIAKPSTGTVAVAPLASLVQQNPQNQQQQQQQQQQIIEIQDPTTHLPTALGLKIRAVPQPQKPQQQNQQSNQNCNSLLKQQLRAGLKDFDSTKSPQQQQPKAENNNNGNESCTALQSLASVAERQPPNTIQPPTANNLHQQFLLHMAANPMLKTNNDFYQQQQQPTQQMHHHEEDLVSNNLELILDTNYKSEPELTLADETAGLDYKSTENSGNETGQTANQMGASQNSNCVKLSPRPVQRRRIRRKAQSTLDDQAEHLTEMSVRGLDLFRYASITEGVYQCTECAKENVQKTFKNKYSFQRHAFLYHEGKHRKVFPCPLCGKEFSRPDKMKNHMKMIHESYVAKDIGNFNPINYLISAAAAGEMHSTFFNQSQQQQQQNQQAQVQLMTQQNTAGVVSNEAAPKEDLILAQALTGGGGHQSPPSPLPAPATALLKLHNDIVIKKEIVISPSPSPPPITSATHAAAVATVQQRIEEVK